MADRTAVLALWRRAGAEPSPTDTLSALQTRLRRDRCLFVLAWDGGRRVGSVMGGLDGWRASMSRLAVDPGYRRRGIARLLVTAVEEELRRLGARRISSLVRATNPTARAYRTT